MFLNSLSGLTPDLDKSLTNSPFSDERMNANYENIFSIKKEEELPQTPVQSIDDPIKAKETSPKKRLNGLDGNILVEHFSHAENKTGLEKIFSKFLPAFYRKKIVAEAIVELTTLSKIAHEIITKQIPYGEQDATYEDLITYLSSASSIHAKLKRKI